MTRIGTIKFDAYINLIILPNNCWLIRLPEPRLDDDDATCLRVCLSVRRCVCLFDKPNCAPGRFEAAYNIMAVSSRPYTTPQSTRTSPAKSQYTAIYNALARALPMLLCELMHLLVCAWCVHMWVYVMIFLCDILSFAPNQRVRINTLSVKFGRK